MQRPVLNESDWQQKPAFENSDKKTSAWELEREENGCFHDSRLFIEPQKATDDAPWLLICLLSFHAGLL